MRGPLIVHESVISRSGMIYAPAFLLVFVVSGRAIVHFEGETVLAREGTVLALPPGTQGTHERLLPLHTISWIFDEEFVAAHAQWMPPSHPLSATIEAATAIPPRPGVVHLSQQRLQIIREPLLHLAALEHRNSLTHYERLARTAEVLDFLDPQDPPHPVPLSILDVGPRRHEVVRALRLVDESIDRPWSVQKLAAAVALSPSQLTRLFRTMVGVSPGAYIWQRRTEVMADLLGKSGLTVEEAAQAAGWHSRSAASRAFRRWYGVSPREFTRRANRRFDPDGA